MIRLPAAFTVDGLRRTWRASRDATSDPGSPGIDWVRAGSFAADLDAEIRRIREDLRAGNYHFAPLRLTKILKEPGKYRILAVPTVRDRLLQRSLLRHLEPDPKFKPSPISYGFTKGRTLADAQRRARDLRNAHQWVLKCDIVRFFDQIRRPQLKQLIRRRVGWKVVAGLLCQAVDCELREGSLEDAQLVQANGIVSGVGLRQGMPISPMLSNLLLQRFDDALARRGLHAVRYADDIAVFADSRRECEDALRYIQDRLEALELTVPDLADGGKTKLLGPSEPAEFLGVEIKRYGETYRLRAPAGRLEAISDAMGEMATVSRCVERRQTITHLVRSLDSFVQGHAAAMAVLEDGGDFRARLEAAKAPALRQFLIELVGETAVAAMDADRRAVLGLEAFPSISQKR